ncbi:hypothetical protein, partial [Serratia ficaria]|uniref:hypothetical protein n=1 Tax=Serratia ficaria TaxID=61651 RepID=UPI0014720C72
SIKQSTKPHAKAWGFLLCLLFSALLEHGHATHPSGTDGNAAGGGPAGVSLRMRRILQDTAKHQLSQEATRKGGLFALRLPTARSGAMKHFHLPVEDSTSG